MRRRRWKRDGLIGRREEGMYWAGAAVQTRVTDKGEGGEAKRATRSGGKLSRAEQATPGKQKERPDWR